MLKTNTQKALDAYTVESVRKVRDEHICSIQDARKMRLDQVLTKALALAHGWEDVLAIQKFIHTYKVYSL